jgi:hypothetical protein
VFAEAAGGDVLSGGQELRGESVAGGEGGCSEQADFAADEERAGNHDVEEAEFDFREAVRVMSDVLLKIGGVPVYVDEDEHLSWTGEFTVDGDGSPRCYGPEGTDPLDYLGNAGYPGNWWGVATHNQQSSGQPIIQKGTNPWPGYYVSTTAYIHSKYYWHDPRRYLDSESVLFAVIPGNVRKAVVGICKGCKARCTDKKNGKSVDCVIGDIGPTDHLGEGSIKLAGEFGLDISPKYGGSADESRFLWECWPGVAAPGYVLQG